MSRRGAITNGLQHSNVSSGEKGVLFTPWEEFLKHWILCKFLIEKYPNVYWEILEKQK